MQIPFVDQDSRVEGADRETIDAYNDAHHYRAEKSLTNHHEDEAPVETDKLKSLHYAKADKAHDSDDGVSTGIIGSGSGRSKRAKTRWMWVLVLKASCEEQLLC